MSVYDPRVEAYFVALTRWQDPLIALRRILQDSPLEEDFKWNSPCYTYKGSNLATLWAMKNYCSVSFFKGVLLEDPDARLVAPGANSRSMRVMRFTTAVEVARDADQLRAFVGQAIAAEDAGVTVPFPKDDLEWPEELIARLEADVALAEAFAALTPGRQRGYVLHVSGAKQAKTRNARIDKHAPRILAGKGLHDR
jgi:uncharacterized protein YdeI (YjbR/CyaY-like superfamily)